MSFHWSLGSVVIAASLMFAGCANDQTSHDHEAEADYYAAQYPVESAPAYTVEEVTTETQWEVTTQEQVAPAPTPVTQTPQASQRKHTIKAGDTLWSIATKYYGNGNQWERIVDANPGLSPNALRIGQEIIIPE